MMIRPAFRIAATSPAFARGLRIGLKGFSIALCTTAWTAISDGAMAQIAAPCTQDVSWDNPPQSISPADICGSGDSPTDFHAFSWQLFKFLVWPASAQRGIPDAAKKITDQGASTFETLKADWEIFRENAEAPADWTAFPALADPCSNHPKIEPGALVLATFNEFGNITEGELGQNSVHLLVAQNQTYVRYQAAFNQAAFDTILHNQLYDTSKVSGIPPAPDRTPVAETARQPAGALTVKSAWIELPGPRPVDASRFYVRQKAWVQDMDTRACRMADVGLVGLHIVYKSSKQPQWIWSTFEHVDNAPEPNPEPNRTYTFNDGTGTPMSRGPDEDFKIPKPATAAGPGTPPRPYQVQRLQPIKSDVADLNRAQQAKLASLGSVWKNYKLVTTQWPVIGMAPNRDANAVIPSPACAGPNGTATANTTMETFFQASSSCGFQFTCMGCHDKARRTDSVWSILFNHNKPPNMTGPAPRTGAIKSLVEVLHSLGLK